MSNINPNINKFFNKLYVSFPSIASINKSKEFGNMRYVYKTRDSSKWFVKYKTDQEVFLFGKLKEDIPQPPLLTLTFDKISTYSKECSGIINAKNVYINVEYFIDNYPEFKTSLNEGTIDVFVNGNANSINVIKLGNYVDNMDSLIDDLNILLNELDEFKSIEETKPDITIKNNDIRTCEICGKKLKNNKFKLCKKCSKKRSAANILVNLLKYVDPQTPFEKNDLKQVYEDEMDIKHCIWSLVEFNLVTTNNDEYCLVDSTKLNEFIEEYGIMDEIPLEKEEKKEEPKKLNKQCSICKKTLPTSKFYTSNKTDDGLEDYCKKCKKLVFAANCLKEILNQVSPGSEFKVDDLKNNYKNPLEFTGRLYELQHNDLIFYNSDKEVYILADLETCQNFLDSYYIKGSITIEPEIKKETEIKELTESQQMDSVIESIKNGKTDKEAAEIAGINLYKITHWFNEGKNNYGKEYIDFYNRYNEAKNESKINSCKNFYVIESFNLKEDLTIADTLRKQQMEKILKEIGSGSTLKTAAFNSGITYETLQYWYKRGKQNFGEEYNEFYEKINILQGPNDVPKLNDKPKQQNKNENHIIENKYKNTVYEHILDPISSNFVDSFKSAPKSKTGFAWVFKGPYNWKYYKTIENKPITIQRKNLFDLYLEVKKRKLPWGVRDLNRAKQSLNECEPNWNEINDDFSENEVTNTINESNEFEHILDPLPIKYRKRFKKSSSTGFAWVKKEKNSWRYNNKILGKNVQNLNLYELYLDVKEKNLPWGVRDLEKAKESLAQCKKPRATTIIVKTSEAEKDYLFEHILDPIPREYLKRFRKPSSSGLAWVNNINNTWGYTNPKDNVRIYDNNIYNLYLKVKEQNLPWGVRDLEKAKESLAQCKKPNRQPTINSNEEENTYLKNCEVNCFCFEENNNIKIIINGLIKNDDFINTLYKFKPYEKNIKKIISNRHTQFTELFIELELEKIRFNTFKDKINMFGWKIMN